MKKLVVIFMIGMILLMTVGIVFAKNIEDSIREKLEAKGKEIVNVTEIDFNDLPSEINIENVGDTNLAIYKVDYKEGKPMFAITASDKMFKETTVKEMYVRTILNFGFDGEMNESRFLKTSTGVEGGLEKGYVMIRRGSITGISTNLDVVSPNNLGQIEIVIYKNGEAIGFGNNLNAVSSGTKRDYDIQSMNTVVFEPGDVISVYAKVQGELVWKDVITIIEITGLS